MPELSLAKQINSEQNAGQACSPKNPGSLKTEGKNYSISPFSDTESASAGVPKFLENINSPEFSESLTDHQFTYITPEIIETESEIANLLLELSNPKPSEQKNLPPTHRTTSQNEIKGQATGIRQTGETTSTQSGRSDVVHSSLFSLARSLNLAQSETRQRQKTDGLQDTRKTPTDKHAPLSCSIPEEALQEIRHFHENRSPDREKQDKQEHHEEREDKENPQVGGIDSNKKIKQQKSPSLKTAVNKSSRVLNNQGSSGHLPNNGGGVDSIYIRFMALMARILGQAEAEAHQLYLRIKERTDNIDLLTLLISKINATKGDLDWSSNEEMKTLVAKARSLGVEIPEGKEQWTEDEKKLFKENIQMRKDSMEKVTQLERTDMQRYLQEASQCHQARSNILKLLKEVMDTIIANMRV